VQETILFLVVNAYLSLTRWKLTNATRCIFFWSSNSRFYWRSC